MLKPLDMVNIKITKYKNCSQMKRERERESDILSNFILLDIYLDVYTLEKQIAIKFSRRESTLV